MDLKTLQYPRYIHHGQHGSKLVQDAKECDAAMDAGWVLSPDDTPRATLEAQAPTVQPLDSSTDATTTDDTEHVDGEAESRLPVADVPEPDAPTRKRGRPHKRT